MRLIALLVAVLCIAGTMDYNDSVVMHEYCGAMVDDGAWPEGACE